MRLLSPFDSRPDVFTGVITEIVRAALRTDEALDSIWIARKLKSTPALAGFPGDTAEAPLLYIGPMVLHEMLSACSISFP